MVYVWGMVLMLGADAQKNFLTKQKPGLITNGYFKWTRSPNYIGEMLIYSSFALNCQSTMYWTILVAIWFTSFPSKLYLKDNSLSKKEGWEEYKK
jgi:steroid 5-alpha reductase family enzyme